jgi:hypothetical protein
MQPPIAVRAITPAEHGQLTAGLRSSDAVTRRRGQTLLASARGQRPATIARNLGCATQRVRHASQAFATSGRASLHAQSRRPTRPRFGLEAAKREPLRALLHQRPRPCGKPRRPWTLAFAAEVCGEQGLTPYQVSLEQVRQALNRLGVRGQRATSWSTSPDPH